MRKWGTLSLMLFAFVVGFASTYSCGGGGGSSSSAADYAPLVHEHDGADITSGVIDVSLIPSHSHAEYALSSHSHAEYALSDHSHDDYATSIHSHGFGDLTGTLQNSQLSGTYSGAVNLSNVGSMTVGTLTATGSMAGNLNGTLDGLDSSDFASSQHTHSEINALMPGIAYVSDTATVTFTQADGTRNLTSVTIDVPEYGWVQLLATGTVEYGNLAQGVGQYAYIGIVDSSQGSPVSANGAYLMGTGNLTAQNSIFQTFSVQRVAESLAGQRTFYLTGVMTGTGSFKVSRTTITAIFYPYSL